MFIRSFGVVLAVAALWWSTSSFGLGLGLGELKIDSALSAPLKARIPLRGLAEIDLDPEQFSITIDSSANADIEYRLERIDADNANLILYTRKSISEPLFEFRVEVRWDRSAVARSYDVFMDPPSYASNPAPETATASALPLAAEPGPAPGQAAAAEGAIAETGSESVLAEDASASAAGAERLPPPIAPGADASSAPGVTLPAAAILPRGGPVRLSAELEPDAISGEPRREYGPTIDGNSIWRVARAVATGGNQLSIYQWMHAIWKTNPGAFYQNNMHRLNMNELLVIPFEREVAESSRAQAYRAYREQLVEFETATQPMQTALVDETPANDEDVAGGGDETVPRNGIAADADITEQTSAAATGESVSPATSAAAIPSAAARADEPAASASTTADVILSEEESLQAVMALIEELEASEASIVVNPASADDALAQTQEPVVMDELEGIEGTMVADFAQATPGSVADAADDPGTMSAAPAAGSPGVPADTPDTAPAMVTAAGEWNNTLDGRRDFIASLPVIGSEAALSLIGRGIQRVDEFIATSPSWAALASGVWLTLIIVMLSREMQSRSRSADAENLPQDEVQPLVQTSPTPVMAPATPAFSKLPLEQPKPRAPLRLPPRDNASKPVQPRNVDFNADEILTKADSFLQAKNSAEAIKLLELAIKLQPGRIAFVVRLLEIFHQLQRADDFEVLIQRFGSALRALDRDEKIRLQALYTSLCPRSTPFFDPDRVDEEEQLDDDCDVTEAEEQGGRSAGPNADDGLYIDTQIIVMNNGVPLDEGGIPGAAGMVGTLLDLEDTLNEVDVYLAYGLYDNAEELLLKGLEVDPNRVDYLAKLLDTYYATANLVDFVTCAEALREMGDEALNEYWDKVEVMGYELAPYNELFAGGKDRSLDGVELQLSKPQSADFDPGASDGPAGQSADHVDPNEGMADPGPQEDDDLDLDFKLGSAEALSDDDEDADEAGAVEWLRDPVAADADELVAEILAEDEDEDSTDLDLDSEKTTNVNFSEDEARLTDQLLEQDGEDEDPDLGEIVLDDGDSAQDTLRQIEAVGSRSPVVEAGEQDGDDIEDDLQAAADDGDEAMQFTMSEGNDGDIDNSAAGAKPAAELAYVAGEKLSAAQPGESRILQFPDTGGARDTNAEFEAEVKSTLQALRDQLQYMTERLFRQERETAELRQALSQLNDRADPGGRKDGKKSS